MPLGDFVAGRSGDFLLLRSSAPSELGSRFLKIYESEPVDRGGNRERRHGMREECRGVAICGRAGREIQDGFVRLEARNEARCYGEVIEISHCANPVLFGCPTERETLTKVVSTSLRSEPSFSRSVAEEV